LLVAPVSGNIYLERTGFTLQYEKSWKYFCSLEHEIHGQTDRQTDRHVFRLYVHYIHE